MSVIVSKNSLLIYSLLLISIFGCQKPVDSSQVLKINDSQKNEVRLSSIIKNYRLINLDSLGPVLGAVRKLKKTTNGFCLLTNKTLVFYNNNGDFIKILDRQGRGPEEYLNIQDFIINDDEILILDSKDRTIKFYDREFDFKSEWNINSFGLAIANNNNNNFSVYRGNDLGNNISTKLNIYELDEKKPFKNYFEINPNQAKFLNFREKNNFCNFSDTLIFSHCCNNNIYSITEDEVKLRYTIDFGDNNRLETLLNKDFRDVMEFLEYCKKNPIALFWNGFSETSKKITFFYKQLDRFYHVIYSKNEKKSLVISEYIDDMFFLKGKIKATFENYPILETNGKMYILLEPIKLLQRLKKLNIEINTPFTKSVSELSYSGNPLLLEIELL